MPQGDIEGGSLRIRELTEADREILLQATLINVNWCGERFTIDQVTSFSGFARYTVLTPERGDFGFVALEGDDVAGVVWVLYLPGTEPGYGYLADGVGELSVCVFAGHRGEGTGARLIELALRRAAERGDDRMSLSVEDGNPARRLYARLGFREAEGDVMRGTMVVNLGGDARGHRRDGGKAR